MILHHLLLTLAALVPLSGCGKPNLPSKPPVHVALTATVEIEGKAYPVDFTWTEENYVAWNEGVGWHTEWKSSHRTFVRILDARFAVVVWLPGVADADLEQFHPAFALIQRDSPQFLRSYPDLKTGEKRDGTFQLTQLKIERAPALSAARPMTKDEESLKADIAARKHGYLYGMLFNKEQWSRSPDLSRLLSALKDFTPLGKPPSPPARRKEMPDIWRAFYTFNAGIAMTENMDRHLFGFEFRGDSWTPLSYPGVYWYRERLKDESAPVRISYQGHLIDQQQHELLFDEATQQLVIVWRYGLEPLESSER